MDKHNLINSGVYIVVSDRQKTRLTVLKSAMQFGSGWTWLALGPRKTGGTAHEIPREPAGVGAATAPGHRHVGTRLLSRLPEPQGRPSSTTLPTGHSRRVSCRKPERKKVKNRDSGTSRMLPDKKNIRKFRSEQAAPQPPRHLLKCPA